MIIAKIVLLFFLVRKVASVSCPSGWTGHGSSCYHFSHDREQWSESLNLCRVLGGFLVEINDVTEGRFLEAQVKIQGTRDNYWIGAQDLLVEGDWAWTTSMKTLASTTYTHWSPGEPNNDSNNENCVELLSDGTWNDAECVQDHHYICEMEPNKC